MQQIEVLVNKFIEEIREKFSVYGIYLGYEIQKKSKDIYIWHNSEFLQFQSEEFETFVLSKMIELFEKNNFSNYQFGFDYHKSLKPKMEKEPTNNYNIFKQDYYTNKKNKTANNNYAFAA